MTNPLLKQSSALPFDEINFTIIQQACEIVDRETEAKIDAWIADDDSEPNFENALLPFDTIFKDFERIVTLLSFYNYNKKSDEISDFLEDQEKRKNELYKKVFQNSKIAERFKIVINSLDNKDLDKQDTHFIETIERDLRKEGAFLSPENKNRLAEIDSRLIELSSQFDKNCDKSRKQQAFQVSKISELDGLPQSLIDAMRKNAIEAGQDNTWVFIPERLLVDNMLAVAKNRDFRQRMHQAMANIGRIDPYSNESVIREMHALREERAQLIGFQNHADFQLSGAMAGSFERTEKFLNTIQKDTIDKFQTDLEILTAWVQNLEDAPSKLEPWDLAYYTALYKKDVLNYDSNELSQYLELDTVLQGWITHIEKFFNIQLCKDKTIQTWQEDVIAYRVLNNNTGEESLLYLDLYARPSEKIGGAWASIVQSADQTYGALNGVIYNMNIAKPDGSTPALLSQDDVETLYHEGGHAFHNILGQNAKYLSHRGIRGTSDYFEIPSSIQEHFSFHPDVLETYAFHYKSGNPMPSELLQKMKSANEFMKSAGLLRSLQNSIWDLGFHSMPHNRYEDTIVTQDSHMIGDASIVDLVRPYPLNRFDHLFFDGLSEYAAGYYGYMWAEASAETAFEELFGGNKGPYHEISAKQLTAFYSRGFALPPEEIFQNLCGISSGNALALLKGLASTPQQKAKTFSAPEPS